VVGFEARIGVVRLEFRGFGCRAGEAGRSGKGGGIRFWQCSGNQLLALVYVLGRRARGEFGNPPVVRVTDRNDLDGQLFDPLPDAAWSLRAAPQQADSREGLRDKLSQAQAVGIIITTNNQFAPRSGEGDIPVPCEPSKVIGISVEPQCPQ